MSCADSFVDLSLHRLGEFVIASELRPLVISKLLHNSFILQDLFLASLKGHELVFHLFISVLLELSLNIHNLLGHVHGGGELSSGVPPHRPRGVQLETRFLQPFLFVLDGRLRLLASNLVELGRAVLNGAEDLPGSIDEIVDGQVHLEVFVEQLSGVLVVLENAAQVVFVMEGFVASEAQPIEHLPKVESVLEVLHRRNLFREFQGTQPPKDLFGEFACGHPISYNYILNLRSFVERVSKQPKLILLCCNMQSAF